MVLVLAMVVCDTYLGTHDHSSLVACQARQASGQW
jgi:hypothetical protein